jgi:hypothetical protein
MSRVKLTRWFVNSLLILGVLMIGVVAGLLAALNLYRGAECMALIELGISIEATLYLMKEKRFAEQMNGVSGPPVSVSAGWQALAGGLVVLGLFRLIV